MGKNLVRHQTRREEGKMPEYYGIGRKPGA